MTDYLLPDKITTSNLVEFFDSAVARVDAVMSPGPLTEGVRNTLLAEKERCERHLSSPLGESPLGLPVLYVYQIALGIHTGDKW